MFSTCTFAVLRVTICRVVVTPVVHRQLYSSTEKVVYIQAKKRGRLAQIIMAVICYHLVELQRNTSGNDIVNTCFVLTNNRTRSIRSMNRVALHYC